LIDKNQVDDVYRSVRILHQVQSVDGEGCEAINQLQTKGAMAASGIGTVAEYRE